MPLQPAASVVEAKALGCGAAAERLVRQQKLAVHWRFIE
jgi:hypothetical protein